MPGPGGGRLALEGLGCSMAAAAARRSSADIRLRVEPPGPGPGPGSELSPTSGLASCCSLWASSALLAATSLCSRANCSENPSADPPGPPESAMISGLDPAGEYGELPSSRLTTGTAGGAAGKGRETGGSPDVIFLSGGLCWRCSPGLVLLVLTMMVRRRSGRVRGSPWPDMGSRPAGTGSVAFRGMM